jgi:pimeloyl-ACP methyl ester carboxylesterase
MARAVRVLLLITCASLCVQCARAQQGGAGGQSNASGQAVDVGGRRLSIKCAGAGAPGDPTVVLEAGFGNASDTWARVLPEVAKFARVCAYDRAGLGRSDPAPQPRTVVAVTEDLHALITRAPVAGPYVLVGHSLGGLLVRLYASYYPAEVVGMVLVESAHEDEPDRGVALLPPDTLKEMLRHARPEDLMVRNPAESIDHCSIRPIMDALNWHADIPLVVLTQGLPYRPEDYQLPALAPKYYQLHLELQKELVGRSPRGRQIMAEKSGHFIQQDQPELVVEAIRQVVAAARTDKK